ncbi:MAG TPA: DUF1697 domain-containing protein [Longimicrobiales bacterium]|nr:DUF1697 domain-containing protein [Longimicrobiales bacterium]
MATGKRAGGRKTDDVSQSAPHIGLLRAVNLAGINKVGMADLRELLSGLGFQNVRTLLQSGNVVFENNGGSSAQVEAQLEKAIARTLGVSTTVFIRSAAEWQSIIANNPFVREARDDPGHLLVMCLKREPDDAQATALKKAIVGREVAQVKGRQAYIVYPDGIGRSKLTNAIIEKALGTRGTARNWNTVLKLSALVQE